MHRFARSFAPALFALAIVSAWGADAMRAKPMPALAPTARAALTASLPIHVILIMQDAMALERELVLRGTQ